MLYEISQDTEHLWLELNRLAGAAELVAFDVEFPFFKSVEHKSPHPDITAKYDLRDRLEAGPSVYGQVVTFSSHRGGMQS
jgi:hypothetical protein